MNELNEKMLGFAGLFQTTDGSWNIVHPTNPNAIIVIEDEPNLTQSLDACFKWLVPKLRYANIQFSDQYSDVVPQFSATASVQFADNHTWADNNPALALCLAIEKIIDGEKKC